MLRNFKVTKNLTLRATESINSYLTEINRIDLLTPEEEAKLMIKAKNGDEAAKTKIINSNLRFVVSVAKQFQFGNPKIQLIDLIQEGNIGLCKALEKFDYTKGFKFISYAVWWIRQSILQALEDSTDVKVPLNRTQDLSKVNKAISKFEVEHGRIPNANEISDITNLSEEKINACKDISPYAKSIDKKVDDSDNDSSSLSDLISTSELSIDDDMYTESLRIELTNILKKDLNNRERIIVKYKFGVGCEQKSLEEIGSMLDLTRERVRQIYNLAMKKLRSKSQNELKQYIN